MTEWRRHPRVKESCPVKWSLGFLGHQGHATVRNISISGLLLEVGEDFNPVEDGQYVLEALDPQMENVIPKDAKLVWFSRVQTDKMRWLCGMKFLQSEGPVITRLVEHVENKRFAFHEAMDAKIIQNYLSQSN